MYTIVYLYKVIKIKKSVNTNSSKDHNTIKRLPHLCFRLLFSRCNTFLVCRYFFSYLFKTPTQQNAYFKVMIVN